MDIQKISPDAERRLVDSVQTAIGMTNDGEDPSMALAKVASDLGYGSDHMARMVEMYNTSRTLSHLNNNDGADRGADFPVATIEKVAEALLDKSPAEEAPTGEILSKAANFMGIPEEMTKAAAAATEGPAVVAYERDGKPVVARAVNGERTAQMKFAQAKTNLSEAKDKQIAIFQKMALYFRQPGSIPFDEFETRAIGTYKTAGELMTSVIWDYLGTAQKLQKRGSAPERVSLAPREEPYTFLEDAFRATQEVALCVGVVKKAEAFLSGYRKTLHEKIAELQDASKLKGTPLYIQADPEEDKVEEPEKDDDSITDREPDSIDYEVQDDAADKEASVRPFVLDAEELEKEGSAFSTAFTYEMMNRGVEKLPLFGKPRHGGQLGMMEDVAAGDMARQEGELKAIKAEAILQDMMATDPVISNYDPEEVLGAYNDIAQYAPDSVIQPILLRGYLRKYLESSSDEYGKVMEGFDAKQLADVESKRTEPLQLADIALQKSLGKTNVPKDVKTMLDFIRDSDEPTKKTSPKPGKQGKPGEKGDKGDKGDTVPVPIPPPGPPTPIP